MNTLKLSAVSLALLSCGMGYAVDYTTYSGITENIQRTKGYVTQEEYKSESYKYPSDSYGSVSFAQTNDESWNVQTDLNSPSEKIISIFAHYSSRPTNLEIPSGTSFTLNNSFPHSDIISIFDGNVKFHNGTMYLGQNYRNGNDNDGPNGAFYSWNGNLDIDNVSISSTSDQASRAYELFEVKSAVVNNSTITLSGTGEDEELISGFSLSKSNLTANNLTMTLSGKATAVGIDVDENSTVTLSNSSVAINNENSTIQSALLRAVQSTINISDSTLTTANDNALFSNVVLQEIDSTTGSTLINLTNTTATAEKTLIGVNQFIDSEDNETLNSNKVSFVVNADSSSLTGESVQYNTTYTTPVTLNLTNGSKWSMLGNSTLTNLINENSEVNLAAATTGSYNILTITGDLSGNGTFTLNTDLANEKSDQIVVNGIASGSHTLNVKDSGNEPASANGVVTLVKTQSGDAVFSLANKNYVDAGAYRYRLSKSGNNWILSNQNSESAVTTSDTSSSSTATDTASSTTTDTSSSSTATDTASSTTADTSSSSTATDTETTDTSSSSTGSSSTPINTASSSSSGVTTSGSTNSVATASQNGLKELSSYTNAKVSLRQAQLLQSEQNLNGLRQRLNNLRQDKGGLWVVNQNERDQFASTSTASDSRTSGFTQHYNSLQMGADWAVGNAYLGGFVGSSQSRLNFNGDYGNGKVKSTFAGAYSTLTFGNGFFWDNVYKYERSTISTDAVDKQTYQAHSIATTLGKDFHITDWTITPQAQLAWTRLSGDENVDSLTALSSRVGVRVAKAIQVGVWKWQPYAEVNHIVAKNNDSQVNVNGYKFDVASSNARLETALGVSLGVGGHHVILQVGQATGKNVNQRTAVELGYRYQW